MDKKEFGVWLKKQRVDKGLTQEQLATALGMKHSQEVAGFESGNVCFPIKKISALSKALGVSKEKIFQMTMKIKEQEYRRKMEEA